MPPFVDATVVSTTVSSLHERDQSQNDHEEPKNPELAPNAEMASPSESSIGKVSGACQEPDVVELENVATHECDESTVDPHFSKSDFLPSNWDEAAEFIPPIGFAVVAGGLCMLNPVVFISGVITACTAMGAIHIAQSSYDNLGEGNPCMFFAPSKDVQKRTSQVNQPKELGDEPILKHGVSEVTFTMTSQDESEKDIADMADLVVDSTIPPGTVLSLQHRDPASLETKEEALEWTCLFYPPLSFQNHDCLEFCGLNAQEFFQVFLADNAPFAFSQFQKKRKDKDIRYGQWEALMGVSQPSLVKSNIEASLNCQSNLQERVLHFQAKTKNGLFGPPYANTTKVQRCLVASKRLLILESKTTFKDIPFADRFYVLERWVVVSEKRGPCPIKQQYVSSLSVSCQVVFSKECTFEAFIISKAQDTVTEIALQWNEMAQAALQRTEETRRHRLGQSTDEEYNATTEDENDTTQIPVQKQEAMDESVEVERLGPNQSRILSEDPPLTTDFNESPSIPRRRRTTFGALSKTLTTAMSKRRKNVDVKN